MNWEYKAFIYRYRYAFARIYALNNKKCQEIDNLFCFRNKQIKISDNFILIDSKVQSYQKPL